MFVCFIKMLTFARLFFIVVAVILTFTRATHGTLFFAKGYGRLKNEFVIKKISCGSHLQASSRCALTKNCRSFSRSKNGDCMLYNVNIENEPAAGRSVVKDDSWELYARHVNVG